MHAHARSRTLTTLTHACPDLGIKICVPGSLLAHPPTQPLGPCPASPPTEHPKRIVSVPVTRERGKEKIKYRSFA